MGEKKPIIPSLLDLLDYHSGSALRQMFCALPGKIDKYNAAETTAEIIVLMKHVVDYETNETVDYPNLLDVPVLQLTGGTGGVNVPIAAGDPCLVIFADRDIDNWFATGAAEIPDTRRFHSIADGFALVGFRPLTDQVTRPDYLAASLYKDGTQVSVKGNKVAVKNPTTDLLTLIVALISAINTSVSAATVTIPGGSSAGVYPVANNTPTATDFSPLLYTGDELTP